MAFSILANAICYYVFDRSVNTALTFGDAVWYSVISVTTIGYGDFSAQTLGARIGTIVFIVILGLSSFSVFLGMVIDGVSSIVSKGKRGILKIMAKDHVLIVNFPGEARVRQIVEEIRSDPEHHGVEIVVISDQINELPFLIENVLFVRGSPHDLDTYERAMTKDARMAVVLSRDYSDPNSDAVAAAAVSVIASIEDEIHIVAECLDDAHRSLFQSVHCNAIVSGFSIAGNLLAQEIHDPGISRMIEMLTSNRKGSTLYSTKVAIDADEGYSDLAKSLLDHGVNLLAVNRGNESLTDLGNLQAATGDCVIYASRKRYTWPQLIAMT
jgi:voltage-gated potassium channel